MTHTPAYSRTSRILLVSKEGYRVILECVSTEGEREKCVELFYLNLEGGRVAFIWVTLWRGGSLNLEH